MQRLREPKLLGGINDNTNCRKFKHENPYIWKYMDNIREKRQK